MNLKYITENNNIKEKFYYIAFALMIIRTLLDKTSLIEINKIIDILMIIMIAFLMFMKIALEKYTIKSFFFMMVIGFLCIYTSYKCNFYSLTMTFLTIIAIKDMNLKKILNIYVKILSTYLLICFVIFLYQYFTNNSALEYYGFSETFNRRRYYIFFTHPNNFANLVLWSIACDYYLNKDKISYIRYIIYIMIALITFYFTISRTALILLLLFIAVSYFINISKKEFNNFYKYTKLLYVLCVVVSISLTVFSKPLKFTNTTAFTKLDSLFSRRISLSIIAFDKYGVAVLPQQISDETISWEERYKMHLVVDNAYVKAFVSVGISFLIIYMCFLRKGITKDLTKTELLIICTMFISGLLEDMMYASYLCFPTLIIANNIFNNKKREMEIKSE